MSVQIKLNLASSEGYTVPLDEPALAAALDAMRHWSQQEDLVKFALARHGYCDTDGFFGITYPGDLDEYDRIVLGKDIPEGFVEAVAWYGEHNGPRYLLEETSYLDLLGQYLALHHQEDLVQQLTQGRAEQV